MKKTKNFARVKVSDGQVMPPVSTTHGVTLNSKTAGHPGAIVGVDQGDVGAWTGRLAAERCSGTTVEDKNGVPEVGAW